MKPFVLRLPKQEILLPYQVLNEITCISIVSSNWPGFPLPVVHAFATDISDAFIAEEYLHGEPLSSCCEKVQGTHPTQAVTLLVQSLTALTQHIRRFSILSRTSSFPFPS
jgi:hypothetical protein